jgi:glycosyltransferase involved in cell wall biosynthesis
MLVLVINSTKRFRILKSKSVEFKYDLFIANHSNGKEGRLFSMLNYLNNKNINYLVLNHPLNSYSTRPSTLETKGKIIKLIRRKELGIFNLMFDFYYSVYNINKCNFDVFMGTNNFDMLPVVFFRLFFKKSIKRVIYYPSDYASKRFDNKILNFIYKTVENIAVRYSDCTISNTYRAQNDRILLNGLDRKKGVVIPNPIVIPRPDRPKRQFKKDEFIFIGDVSKEHGLSDLVNVIHPLIKKLVVIGIGEDLDATIRLSHKNNIEIELHGLKSHDYSMDYLHKFKGIGLAPYNLKSEWTYYASPVKVGEYIASYVPVLMSDVPSIADEVKREGLGVVYHKAKLSKIKKSIDNFSSSSFYDKSNNYYKCNNPEQFFKELEYIMFK